MDFYYNKKITTYVYISSPAHHLSTLFSLSFVFVLCCLLHTVSNHWPHLRVLSQFLAFHHNIEVLVNITYICFIY